MRMERLTASFAVVIDPLRQFPDRRLQGPDGFPPHAEGAVNGQGGIGGRLFLHCQNANSLELALHHGRIARGGDSDGQILFRRRLATEVSMYAVSALEGEFEADLAAL